MIHAGGAHLAPPITAELHASTAKCYYASLYARVSTTGQQSVPAQLELMRQYAERRGWQVVQEVAEVGSGAKTRPKREALMVAARAREIDAVIVAKLDRWARSLPDLVNTMQELTALGVGFVSLSDSLDLTTPAGRALAGMLSVFANFERDLIVERVRGGMEHAKRHGTRSGRPIGRPPTIAKREIEIRALTNAGVSIAEIARRLKIAGTAARIASSAPSQRATSRASEAPTIRSFRRA